VTCIKLAPIGNPLVAGGARGAAISSTDSFAPCGSYFSTWISKSLNVKQRQDYERKQKARYAAKDARGAKMSRSETHDVLRQRTPRKESEETMEAVKEFNEARGGEKEPPWVAPGRL
jgi:hypothetical protein